ncbi:MAG: hypothetical protein PHD36_09240 [Desulfotomaculaceae bacterium]|nr:hypothetical protein [Desulfotomaculaceae bacterium]
MGKYQLRRINYQPQNTNIYDKDLSPEVINQHLLWISAENDLKYNSSILSNLPNAAKNQAYSELKAWAWQERDIATAVWATLLAISIISLIVMLRQVIQRTLGMKQTSQPCSAPVKQAMPNKDSSRRE